MSGYPDRYGRSRSRTYFNEKAIMTTYLSVFIIIIVFIKKSTDITINNMANKIKEQEKIIEDLQLQIKYMPNYGTGYQEAKEDFESRTEIKQ